MKIRPIALHSQSRERIKVLTSFPPKKMTKKIDTVEASLRKEVEDKDGIEHFLVGSMVRFKKILKNETQ